MLAFKSAHPEVEFELSIIVHVSASAPAVSLSAYPVRVLASLNTDIDVDSYRGDCQLAMPSAGLHGPPVVGDTLILL